MTLRELIGRLEAVAKQQPSVKCIVRNNIFTLSTRADARYGVFSWTQGTHRSDPDTGLISYSLVLYYVDRLTEDEGNRLEVQSSGIQVLEAILRNLEAEGIYYGQVNYTTFTQKFLDSCAGAFANVTFEVPASSLCGDSSEDTSSVLIIG